VTRALRVLLVDDNPGDADLTRDTLEDGPHLLEIAVVVDGAEAVDYLLRRGTHRAAPTPDLVLLDLNLPRIDGAAVLAEIQRHDTLRTIPVVVWTSSDAEHDIARSYALGARCFVTKPFELGKFQARVRAIEQFWFDVAKLP